MRRDVEDLKRLASGQKTGILRLKGEEEKLTGKCECRDDRRWVWKCRSNKLGQCKND